MIEQSVDAICSKCGTHFTGLIKSSFVGVSEFLGFKQTKCPDCSSTVTQPLSSSTRKVYFSVLVVSVILFVFFYIQGQVVLAPNFIGIAVICALLRDFYLRKEISATLSKFPFSSAGNGVAQSGAQASLQSIKSSSSAMDSLERLSKLKELKDSGLISEADFEIKKTEILRDL